MNSFCGSEFWNSTITWNTTSPDFTPCFEKTIFVFIPGAFLFVFAGFELRRLLKSKNRDVPRSWVNISKIILSVLLIAIQLSLLIVNISLNSKDDEGIEYNIYGVDFFYPSWIAVALLLQLIFVYYGKKRGIQTSGYLFGFWFLMLICGIASFRTSIIIFQNEDEIEESKKAAAVYCVTNYPLVILMFFVNCFADKAPKIEEYRRGPNHGPEVNASFLNQITFTWLDGVIWKGFKTPLKQEDLWDLPQRNITKVVLRMWDKQWKRVTERFRQKKEKSVNQEEVKFSVLPVILRTFWKSFLAGLILKLIPDMLAFASPQVLRLLIEYVDDPSIYEWKGYFYAVLLFCITETQSLLNAQQFIVMYECGLRIRATLTSAVYEKALKISSSSKKESTVGEIVNLMAVDVQRFLDLMGFINNLWSAPIQILLCIYFLWRELGPSALVGLLVMVILIPVNGVIAGKQKQLQIAQMKQKDRRVKIVNEILNGIKVLKLYAWELSFIDHIKDIRNEEVKVLKKNAYFGAITSFLFTCTPFLVAFFMFMTYVLTGDDHILTPDKVFVSLSLLNILRMPMTFLPLIIITMVQASVSLKRMNAFLRSEELDPRAVETSHNKDDAIIITNGTFSWGHGEDDKPILKNINLRVKEGSLVGVVGVVGSGKSSLCLSILGEMEKDEGKVIVNKSIAYVPQQAWIQNATLRNNILFGKKFINSNYNKVLKACALEADLEMLADGDQTEIGEKGINLSGGQKQRVNLARACYSDLDLFLLDDPLSAVDSHVGKHIFDNVIGPSGMLGNKTRVLVTHGLGYLKHMDEIVVIKDGEIVERGTLAFLIKQKGDFQEFLLEHLNENDMEDEELEPEVLEEIKKTIHSTVLQRQFSQESTISSESHRKYSHSSSLSKKRGTSLMRSSLKMKEVKDVLSNKGKIIKEETTGAGEISMAVYIYYAKAIGILASVLTIVFYASSQAFSVLGNILLSDWSTNPNAIYPEVQNKYLGVYGSFGIGQAISNVLAYSILARATILGARKLHNAMLNNVLRSPMSFFDVTPIGRIVNRFSKDIDIIDILLPMNIRSFLMLITGVIATFAAIIYATPIFAAVVLPALVVYYFIQKIYVTTSRQLKRIESVTRSPIYTHFGESIQGATTIRAYKKQEEFLLQIQSYVDLNHYSYYLLISSYRWLSIRLEFIGNCLIFFAALFIVLSRDPDSGGDAGNAGLSLTYALSVTGILNYLVRVMSDVETNIVSVERIKEYTELQNEAKWEKEEKKPKEHWPGDGEVIFKDYSTRYRDGLDLVVKNINCHIKSTEKIGIVGRTGAGKSSLTLALFRIVEPATGTIIIDGVDVSKIGLHDLRGKLTIIPQDPVLFSGTLRLNLDPFSKYEDNALWDALEHSHLKEFISGLPAKLNHEVAEGGENLSVGQRQLVCLARALLRKSKVLILDEATAAVDLETDALIQDTIRVEFADSTVITIAHRLNTIMDSTRIMVLDRGEIKEFDSPESLLANNKSLFYDLAKSAGLV